MTTRPTVEGVSEERIQRLIDDLQSQVDDLVRNGETHTGSRYRDSAAALRELLAARQQLAEMRGAESFNKTPVCPQCIQKLRQYAPNKWECVRCP